MVSSNAISIVSVKLTKQFGSFTTVSEMNLKT
jgi:hypothetical protein